MTRLILLNKPFGVLCQFRDKDGRPVLADYLDVPGVYPAGRLDHDSEGLLLLTDDGALQARIADPRFKLPKTYLVQVEGEIDDAALARLAAGVELNDGPTLPASARRVPAPALWERVPPVRFRAAIPTSWLELTIREGRNRQVRRMTAAVGFPTLRLVRVAIGPWRLDGLAPGEWREVGVAAGDLPGAEPGGAGQPPRGRRPAPRPTRGGDGGGGSGSGSGRKPPAATPGGGDATARRPPRPPSPASGKPAGDGTGQPPAAGAGKGRRPARRREDNRPLR